MLSKAYLASHSCSSACVASSRSSCAACASSAAVLPSWAVSCIINHTRMLATGQAMPIITKQKLLQHFTDVGEHLRTLNSQSKQLLTLMLLRSDASSTLSLASSLLSTWSPRGDMYLHLRHSAVGERLAGLR